MNKPNITKQNKSSAIALTVIGFLLTASAFFIAPVIAHYLNLDCKLDSFGSCPFEISLPNAVLAQKIAVATGVVGVAVMASGIFAYFWKKK